MDFIQDFFRKNREAQFAIRRETLGDGKVRLTPVVKMPGLFNNWITITKNFDRYIPIDLGTDHVFTEDECMEFIEGYRQQIREGQAHQVQEVTYQLA